MKLVFFGLTITSSWGNGHATTYRSLLKALHQRGHQIHFVEQDAEWYRSNRDLPEPEYCTVHLYDRWQPSEAKLLSLALDADAIVLGSYFSDAVAATQALLAHPHPPLLFYDIDTPITLAQLRAERRTAYLEATLIPHYAAYLSFTGGPALLELEQTFGSPLAISFYCSVDPNLYHPTPCHPEYLCDLSYLGTYAADRQPKLMSLLNGPAALLPHSRFLVAGPLYPQDTPWRPNVQHIPHLPPPEHPAFYSSSRFTLNLTRADMVLAGYSPSVRLFEASACGAAILSDRWPGLDELLTPGEEVLLPRDEYEVADLLQNLPEADRLQLGRRARERILSQHTSAHRAEQFEEIIAALPGR